jgi:hypothetical protein
MQAGTRLAIEKNTPEIIEVSPQGRLLLDYTKFHDTVQEQ